MIIQRKTTVRITIMAKTDKDVLVHMRCATTWIAFGLKEIKSIKVNSKFDMLLSLEDGRELYVDEIKPIYGIEGKDYERE